MNTKIIALCFLATITTLTLTACTGKEPAIVDNENCNNVEESNRQVENNSSEPVSIEIDINSSESGESSQDENISSENAPNKESESSINNEPSTDNNEQTSVTSNSNYTEMPQEILNYCKDNNMKIEVESFAYGEKEGATADMYRIYIDETDKISPVGAILDLTNEQEPEILYHHIQNAEGQIIQESEGMSGTGMLGKVYVVKFNEDGEISEFFKWEREIGLEINRDNDPLYVYGDLHVELNK